MSVECGMLHSLVNKIPKFHIKEMDYINVPSDGIYFITESGEFYRGLERIVRIGFNKKKGNLPNKIREVLWGSSSFRKNLRRAVQKKYKNFKNSEEINAFLDQYIRDNMKIGFVKIGSSRVRKRLVRKFIKCMESAEHYKPSPHWLGKSSSKAYIRKKGFWHLQNFKTSKDQLPDSIDLEFLSERIKKLDKHQQ
ncbi:hypothetical protein [uncultured Ilyobacter sp.]|uniref:hypothetical protein n=1 Tax=uncultured Ilyobacter sp. TaxID=544433 RepID=UPI0029F4A81C|nr:hypothetical protein [uncultured Ilyobacter sp.]